MSSVQVHPAAQPDWNNLDVLHRNTLAPRANFYVYDSARDALSYDVTKSKTYRLSGEDWKFQHSKNPFEAPEGFESPSYDTAQWDDVAVPSMWQLNGYGKGPHYTNVNFPIPVDPPNVPFDDNETGSYVKKFTVPESLQGSQLRLRFEGVDSAFHVWINGKEIGYHQGSRNPSEFEITSAVDEGGENTLAVRVYQWSDATYIEDQVSVPAIDEPEHNNKKTNVLILRTGPMENEWHLSGCLSAGIPSTGTSRGSLRSDQV